MFLLDTNVVSELRKAHSGKADKNVVRWVDSINSSECFLSAISVQELEIGVMLMERRDKSQGGLLRAWLENHVLPAFKGRIVAVDTAIARRSAALQVPDPRPILDCLIAATALLHGMTVVTRNTSDFDRTGVPTLNPWHKAG